MFLFDWFYRYYCLIFLQGLRRFLFGWFYSVFRRLKCLWQKEAKILFLGLDSAGNTTLLHMLKDQRLVKHQPTQYRTSEELSIGKIKVKAFDLGGPQIVRRVWKDYYAKVDAVVYLVDLADGWRYVESFIDLHELLSDDSLTTVPCLILGNMIDTPFSLSDLLCEILLDLQRLDGKEVFLGCGTDSIVRAIEFFMCRIVKR